MEFSFILGIFTGALVPAAFAAWAAWHEWQGKKYQRRSTAITGGTWARLQYASRKLPISGSQQERRDVWTARCSPAETVRPRQEPAADTLSRNE